MYYMKYRELVYPVHYSSTIRRKMDSLMSKLLNNKYLTLQTGHVTTIAHGSVYMVALTFQNSTHHENQRKWQCLLPNKRNDALFLVDDFPLLCCIMPSYGTYSFQLKYYTTYDKNTSNSFLVIRKLRNKTIIIIVAIANRVAIME